ncbi:hypothetical protein Micbo1qcDRAFT_235413 [Microdochium bolleyi]|uniref:Calcium-transporting ATPase 2 n=1 Tax=Microdochium bolleyi TaxID=196109 RepID=A0A136IVX9_9PEZI|nr:hypothetical protein Micbo1qcDRAFT_235413 [Microdochium bolleyi]
MASTPPAPGSRDAHDLSDKITSAQTNPVFDIDWSASDDDDDDLNHNNNRRRGSRASHPANDGKFAFSTAHLHQLSEARSPSALEAFGGIRGLAAGLRTNIETGLGVDEDRLDGTITRQDAFDAQHAASSRTSLPTKNEASTTPAPQAAEETHLTDLLHVPGLLGDDRPKGHRDRRDAFGENRLPQPKSKSFLELAWLAFNDKLIFLLVTSATISLALGIYEAVSADPEEESDGSNLEWVESVTIMAAVIVIVFASAANDYHKNYRFQKLNVKKQEGWVTVIRSGNAQRISVFDVLVGDILRVEAGDILHADGILVEGKGVQCDESSLTGEAEIVYKSPAVAHAGKFPPHDTGETESDAFVFSGTKVVHGIGAMLVTAVGTRSMYGRIQLSLRGVVEQTPLQVKLGRLAKYIIIVGFIVGTIFFFAQFIRWCVNLQYHQGGPEDKGESFLKIFMLAVTVVVIGVPEGLSLAVAVALAFGTSRMLRDNNLVRLLRSCEVMGNATTICSDKTGTLTQNKMSVVTGIVGTEQFGGDEVGVAHKVKDTSAGAKSESDEPAELDNSHDAVHATARYVGLTQFAQGLNSDVKGLLRDMVALNTTAFEQSQSGGGGVAGNEADPSQGDLFIGSGTETALLRFGREHLGMGPLAEERKNTEIVEMLPFNPVRKWMGVVVALPGSEGVARKYRLLVKGAAEMLLDRCSMILEKPEGGLAAKELDSSLRQQLEDLTTEYAKRQLRPIALAYRDLPEWPPHSGQPSSSALEHQPQHDTDRIIEEAAEQLTFIGTLGVHDPLRPEVVDAVRQCQTAGVFVRMVTGDNIETAKSIAQECGIFTAGGIALDGPTFRALTEAERDVVLPRLQVLARSSPDDKEVLVRHLRRLGETVAVTGDGTNDAFALKAADVGFAMGVSGTDVAKEASAIILMDDNFASIVSALKWGRVINDSAKKFCQFQFTINITAGLLTIVTTLVENVEAAVFAVIQLLWLNLIMDIFAALALATDFPTKTLLHRRPDPRNAPIITPTMWKMVLGQAVYQLVVIFTLHYTGFDYFMGAGGGMAGVESWNPQRQMQTFVFNCYMFMQVFNQTNCRRTDNRFNVFEGIHRNTWFLLVQVITIGGQVAIVLKGGSAFQTEPLTAAQWGWSLFFGLLTFPVGALIRMVPDSVVLLVASKYLKPLAWPIVKVVRWSRERKLIKTLEKEMKEAAEVAAAERAKRGLNVDEDEDDGDEERQIRRMHWRLGRRRNPQKQQLRRQAKMQIAKSKSTLPGDANATGVLENGQGGGETARPVSSKAQTPEFMEALTKRLSRAGDESTMAAAKLSANQHSLACFQVHPDTQRDDPVFVPPGTSSSKLPPSQDPEVLQYLGFATGRK